MPTQLIQLIRKMPTTKALPVTAERALALLRELGVPEEGAVEELDPEDPDLSEVAPALLAMARRIADPVPALVRQGLILASHWLIREGPDDLEAWHPGMLPLLREGYAPTAITVEPDAQGRRAFVVLLTPADAGLDLPEEDGDEDIDPEELDLGWRLWPTATVT